jgi:uncharacterized protein YdeI (YjbR/CyaY-like superfamily)
MSAEVRVRTRAAWRRWLAANHTRPDGVYAVFRRKAAAGPRDPSYDDLVEEALCFGWVDSRPKAVDDEWTGLYFSPRKRGSGWAATNKARVERLVAQGLMEPAGLAAIEQAKADGSWSRIDGSESGLEPADLAAALAGHPGAREHWDALPPGVRRAILQWIEQAKTPPTRVRRIEETASKAARNERANQWVPKDKR